MADQQTPWTACHQNGPRADQLCQPTRTPVHHLHQQAVAVKSDKSDFIILVAHINKILQLHFLNEFPIYQVKQEKIIIFFLNKTTTKK